MRKPKKRSAAGCTAVDEPTFEPVALSEDGKTFLCKLSTGAVYELPAAALRSAENWDRSGVAAWKLIDWKHGALVRLKSGAEIDFSPDFVLHVCEPRYAYYGPRFSLPATGAKIRAVRRERKMSLADLAAKTGIAKPNLSRLETGKHSPRLETLDKLAKALNVSTMRLLYG